MIHSTSSSSDVAEAVYRSHQAHLMTTPMTIPVYLNVYDLHPYNNYLHCAGLGAYHSGVEIGDHEYSYGYHSESTSGVFEIAPGTAEGAEFRHRIHCGDVYLTFQEWLNIIDKIKKQFIGQEYHILYHNCNHFSHALLYELHLPFPRYINRLAYVVSWIQCCIPIKYRELLGIVVAPTSHEDDSSMALVTPPVAPTSSYTRLATPTSYLAPPATVHYQTMHNTDSSSRSPRTDDPFLLEHELDNFDRRRRKERKREREALERISHVSRDHSPKQSTTSHDTTDETEQREELYSPSQSMPYVGEPPIQLDLLDTSASTTTSPSHPANPT